MNKRILILTAGSSGGHRSASNALKSAFLKLDSNINILDYDSNYLFLGYNGKGGEQGYITITTRFRIIWKIFFEITSFFKSISNYFLFHAIKRNFTRLIIKEKPDVIISLHPCFVGSALKVLRKISNIPFYVVVLDPMKHSNLWQDKKVDLTFLPTEETKEVFLSKGFDKNKLVKTGFPLIHKEVDEVNKTSKKKILFVNPSQKSLRLTRKLIEASFKFDIDIDIITGSDGKLKKYLEKNLPKREGLNIYGYVNDMPIRLKEADLLLTKAGPNIMFEAIYSQIPIIFTGHLPGQEETNALYAVNRGYGFVAENPKTLDKLLKRIFIDEPNLLETLRNNEKKCPDLDGAINIASRVLKELSK